ncbi:hypothetical protein N0V82_005983 [Gnomoniopsis sp. IMI 355080]|nr:hypothetical protein N0V82_005983 [Gnomoniopsis sp. IMI 355080]
MCDPGEHMLNQAKLGPVDVITGDYLAEMNLAYNAEAFRRGENPGWISSAWDGIQKSIELLDEKRIKLIINGGCLNPRGLAEGTHKLATEKKLNLKVAYVEGDELLPRVSDLLQKSQRLSHLDDDNPNVRLAPDSDTFMRDHERMPIVSANAYLGIRAIKRGLEQGADIIICGRVSDASPVIAAAAWWHQWPDSAFDELAGALIAGHLIECSTYITGGNFAGFDKYPVEQLLNLGLPIVEIDHFGNSVVTKHDALNGIVTEDTVKCQLLYELQGNIYLNSDVKADIAHIQIVQQAKNRVLVCGVKGGPPPPTTKLAVFYRGGYQAELLFNANGYATSKKWDLQEAQLRAKLEEWGELKNLDVLEFQRPFLAYYPALVEQSQLEESVCIIGSSTSDITRQTIEPCSMTEPHAPRVNYDPIDPTSLSSFGPTVEVPLGDIALARSGDKGANINIGLFVPGGEQEKWEWLRSFMTRDRMKLLMGQDWQDWFHIERIEFTEIQAVHFVIYGPLGRGVSSSKLLDALGKGFAEFIRAVHVPVPKRFLALE